MKSGRREFSIVHNTQCAQPSLLFIQVTEQRAAPQGPKLTSLFGLCDRNGLCRDTQRVNRLTRRDKEVGSRRV